MSKLDVYGALIMLPYILISLFLLVFTFFELFVKMSKPLKLYVYVVFSIFIVFFVGFRQCGFDYENYHIYFEALNSVFWENNSEVIGAEKGYALLNYLLGDYRLLLVVMAIFTVALLFIFVYRYSPAVYFSLFLFFCVLFYPTVMGQYRQMLAIAIVLWAFVVKQRNVVAFLLLVLVAMLFHMSALIAIAALAVPTKILKTKYYVMALVAAFLFMILGSELFYNVVLGGSDFIARKISYYSATEQGMSVGLNLAMLLRIIYLVLFLRGKQQIEQYSFGGYFLNLYFMGMLVYLSFGFLPQLSTRGFTFFNFFEFILPAMLIWHFAWKKKLLYLCFFVGVNLYRCIGFFNEWYDDYIPYSWGISYLP